MLPLSCAAMHFVGESQPLRLFSMLLRLLSSVMSAAMDNYFDRWYGKSAASKENIPTRRLNALGFLCLMAAMRAGGKAYVVIRCDFCSVTVRSGSSIETGEDSFGRVIATARFIGVRAA
jgi:hypothetical protein